MRHAKLVMSLIFCGSLLLVSVPVNAAYKADETHAIRFKKGSSGTDINDKITGSETKDYTFFAKKGQRIHSRLQSAWPFPSMKIIAPKEQVICDDMRTGDTYIITLPASGKYTIRIYQENLAKKEEKINSFTLRMKITD